MFVTRLICDVSRYFLTVRFLSAECPDTDPKFEGADRPLFFWPKEYVMTLINIFKMTVK